MNFKKRVNGSWTNIPHYIHNTSTDTITTPADIYANDTTATVGLKGTTVQNGAPSPSNPVDVNGVGDMSKNLFTGDYAQFNNVGGTGNTYSYFKIDDDFTLTVIAKNDVTVSDEVYFGISTVGGSGFGGASWVVEKNRRYTQGGIRTVTSVTNNRHYVSLFTKSAATLKFITDNFYVMLNYGSESLPYEPYTPYYTIPILCGNQTTNVYLGETQSTRAVKKLALTGNENISEVAGIYYAIPVNNVRAWVGCLCSHCEYGGIIGGNTNISLWVKKEAFTDYPTITDFKAYLAQQYIAGTPVTIWYVLATPETGVVNEPLMKIGDYADEVSGITIPTIAGANTISISTTLQPSEVTATYKGWHPVQSVHEYDSNYTIATIQSLTVAQLQGHTISELQGGEWS